MSIEGSSSIRRLQDCPGRASRNAGGAQQPASAAAGTKTPSVTHACRCTSWLSAEPKRCRKEMPPSRGRAALGMSASGVPPAAGLGAALRRGVTAGGVGLRQLQVDVLTVAEDGNGRPPYPIKALAGSPGLRRSTPG